VEELLVIIILADSKDTQTVKSLGLLKLCVVLQGIRSAMLCAEWVYQKFILKIMPLDLYNYIRQIREMKP